MIEQCVGTAVRRVCVAIPTFRRPLQLESVLSGIAAQALGTGFDVSVLVIDNDRYPSARAAVEARMARYPFALRYAHASEPGLSSVRNAALAFARDGFDSLAMIDDDELPEPQWLAELLRVADATEADVVIGPVPQRLPASAAAWLRTGGFFDLPTGADGAVIDFGYSGNCLLRVASLARLDAAFDPRLNFAGGEDMLFFRQLIARGAKITYAARAIASEPVANERLSLRYLLRLNFRRGNTLAICDRLVIGSAAGSLARALKGFVRLARGVVTLVPCALVRRRAGAAHALCDVAHGLGSLSGLFGYVYQGYQRVDAPRR